MGSNFFRQSLDPVGAIVSKVAGPNSWIAKETSYDPLGSSPVAKELSPGMYAMGQAYADRNKDMNPAGTAAMYPTPYAGVAPTLANASAGYINASQLAAQKAAQNVNQNNTAQQPTGWGY